MTAPKQGDRVRVVLEGDVLAEAGNVLCIGNGFGGPAIDLEASYVVSVEVISPPEPEWKPGDVVRDVCGVVFERGKVDWRRTGRPDAFPDRCVHRPLTRLVPEGQA